MFHGDLLILFSWQHFAGRLFFTGIAIALASRSGENTNKKMEVNAIDTNNIADLFIDISGICSTKIIVKNNTVVFKLLKVFKNKYLIQSSLLKFAETAWL